VRPGAALLRVQSPLQASICDHDLETADSALMRYFLNIFQRQEVKGEV
jgi:hypothetical protein